MSDEAFEAIKREAIAWNRSYDEALAELGRTCQASPVESPVPVRLQIGNLVYCPTCRSAEKSPNEPR